MFDEPLAPLEPNDHKLGGTMWFMCKDTGRPVEFTRLAFAREVIRSEFRVHRIADVWDQAPVLGGFWWIEYGGALDTISDNEEIKRELLSELFGVWDTSRTTLPARAKRESRSRMDRRDARQTGEPPHLRRLRTPRARLMSKQRFDDAVAFGGWSIDNIRRAGFSIRRSPFVHPGQHAWSSTRSRCARSTRATCPTCFSPDVTSARATSPAAPPA